MYSIFMNIVLSSYYDNIPTSTTIMITVGTFSNLHARAIVEIGKMFINMSKICQWGNIIVDSIHSGIYICRYFISTNNTYNMTGAENHTRHPISQSIY